mmetsp:Transcript_40053/g.55653  ORF Transcript_40053/g.55653 Transcript_40053/m.55653 type:complete len:354 (+) Transcript_40053:81-1142(+)|eukprot:CAMPEP_0196587152 /NCGR_PEP_ID=MMETSP1081-20130531/56604_1 /TAXON_ID=36882 /ORGANISM="Pyramimonas amylifera, Strain CCMP720" /LENGTH=353 /DNA_ID=CAMNT_0041909257 /DNA_START=81 /DNA_END=1142 /DNA_ORIENTATION=-
MEASKSEGQVKGKSGSCWTGLLKAPTEQDIRGPRRRHKAFDTPKKAFDYLVVLDFEWTADNKPGFGPAEIIEFPSVLVRTKFPFEIVDEFQVYVRPEVHPILTPFIKHLTGISQDQVDRGVDLGTALDMYHSWLASQKLVYCDLDREANVAAITNKIPEKHLSTSSEARPTAPCTERMNTISTAGAITDMDMQDNVDKTNTNSNNCTETVSILPCPSPSTSCSRFVPVRPSFSFSHPVSFAVVTWGDSDVQTTLNLQLSRLNLCRPPYFDSWINLKPLFKQHFKREPRGGLENVVKSLGLEFEGRAHSGLIDSRNTAKIVQTMLQQGFQFWRTTRGFGISGEFYGQKKRAKYN